MERLIALDHVVKEFDGTRALDDVTLDIPQGIIFGLLGPSGSGKTTTIRLMTGVYAPDSGEVKVFSVPPRRWRSSLREAVGYMPQIPFHYPNLSVSENLDFSASLYGLSVFGRGRRLRELLEIVELAEHRHKLVVQLSGGMRKRLALACALVHDPTLVFLDEPTAGIDPILRQRFWEYFRELRDRRKTLLVTSHYVGEAEYCDQVAIIAAGKLIAVGSPVELRRKALGGDAVDVVTQTLSLDTIRLARQMPEVTQVQPLSFNEMRLFVPDSGEAVPRLAEVFRDHGVKVEAIKEYRPTFDEVFARLVEKAA